jgi:NitT/TauT family transport system permease protein
MRISVATGLLTVVAAEMIGAQTGVGAFVLLQGSLMRSDLLLAGVVTIAALGLTTGSIISMIETRLFKWR